MTIVEEKNHPNLARFEHELAACKVLEESLVIKHIITLVSLQANSNYVVQLDVFVKLIIDLENLTIYVDKIETLDELVLSKV